MSIQSSLTALADAVRSKSGVSGKLTIDGMTAAVNGITVGGGAGIEFYECTAYTPDFAGGFEYTMNITAADRPEAIGEYKRTKYIDPIDESLEEYSGNTAVWEKTDGSGVKLTESYSYGEYYYSFVGGDGYDLYYQDSPAWSRVTDYNTISWVDPDAWEPASVTFSAWIATELPPTTEGWSGYKMVQDSTTFAWLRTEEFASNMAVQFLKPKVGEIYSADTTIRVRKMYDGGAIPIITDGLIFYAPLQSDYEDRISSESASVTSGEFTKYNEVDCVKLDGSGFIQWINNSSIPAGKAAYSMVLKVAPTRLSGWSVFLSMGKINDIQNSIRSNSTYLQGNSQGKLTLDTWQTLVLTRNEGGGSGSAYLNGVLVATSSGGAFAGGDISTPAEIMVGAETANGGNDRSSGYFAHAAIYNRVLSAAEVLEIHNTLMDM